MESQDRTDWKAVRWIYRIIGNKIWNVRVLTFLHACESVIALVYAWLFRSIIDAAGARDMAGLRNAAVWFIVCLAVQITMRAVIRYLEEDGRADIENALKLHLFDQILTRDYRSVSTLHSAEWMNRLTSDTMVVADNLVHIAPGFVSMAVSIIGALVMLVVILPGSMLVVIPAGVILVILSFLFRKKLKELHREIQESDGRLRTFLQERLGSLMIVRIFNGEKQEHEQASGHFAGHKASRMRRNKFVNLSNIGFGIIMNGAYIFGGIYCAYGIYLGTITFGTMAAVLQLISQIKSPFANISGYLPMLYAMIASAERLMEADGFPEEKIAHKYSESEMSRLYDEKFRAVQLENVSFGYDDKMVIEGCSVSINKNETIGITGESGCGKSTLLKLIMRMYPVTSGRVMAETSDGSVPMDAGWRSMFAYVPQGNILMQDTIAGIVSYGHSGNEDEKCIWDALKAAGAEGFVRELPDGIGTKLGESGAGLSEGQMQRLAIARAVYSGRPVLLLDEATSSLDAATEERVLQNLKKLPDKTMIIVTHRASALKITDRVLKYEDKIFISVV